MVMLAGCGCQLVRNGACPQQRWPGLGLLCRGPRTLLQADQRRPLLRLVVVARPGVASLQPGHRGVRVPGARHLVVVQVKLQLLKCRWDIYYKLKSFWIGDFEQTFLSGVGGPINVVRPLVRSTCSCLKSVSAFAGPIFYNIFMCNVLWISILSITLDISIIYLVSGVVAGVWDGVGVWLDAVIAQNPLQQRNIPLPPYTTQLVPQIDPSVPQPVFTITEKAPTRAISWLNAPTSAFTFKTL